MANDVTSKVILGLDPSEFRRGIQQVDAKLKQTSRLFDNLGQVIGATFAVGILQNFAREAMQLGDQLTKVSQGFSRFGSEADLQALRYNTKGLVTDLELMKQATMAGTFGIGIKEMGTLLQFATRRAQETGQSVDYLVESIVKGIGRKSPLILDNLGISAAALRQEMHGVSMEMASVADVSEAVGRIAQKQLSLMGESALTASDHVGQLAVEYQNLKASIGQFLQGAAVGAAKAADWLFQKQGLKLIPDQTISPGATEPSWFKTPSFNFQAMPQPEKAPFSPAKQKELKLYQGELKRVSNEIVYQDQVLRTALIPAYDEFARMIKGAREQLELEAQQLKFASAVGAEFGVILSSAFTAAMNNGTSFFDELQNAIKNYVQQLAVAVATTLALSAIVSAFTGAPLGVAFKGVAQGTGLGGLFGEGGILNMNARVSGSDLLLGTQRSGTNYGRIGG